MLLLLLLLGFVQQQLSAKQLGLTRILRLLPLSRFWATPQQNQQTTTIATQTAITAVATANNCLIVRMSEHSVNTARQLFVADGMLLLLVLLLLLVVVFL